MGLRRFTFDPSVPAQLSADGVTWHDVSNEPPLPKRVGRRSFFGSFCWLVASVFGVKASEPPVKVFRRIFRRDANGEWREIMWEDMRDGDRVIMVGIDHAFPLELEVWEVKGNPFRTGSPYGVDGIEISKQANILPNFIDTWAESTTPQ